MSLPTPNLDDRTFEQIFEEAKRKIPELCPQWTDFNQSDPGITLLQLMAWMAEMIIYRLNRVPEKNYIKFLELMGVSLVPLQPSKAWVVFTVASGVKEEALKPIPPGTKVSTREEKGEPIVFETVDSLNPTTSNIKNMYSRSQDKYTKLYPAKEDPEAVPISFGEKGALIFPSELHLPHILCLGLRYHKAIDKKFYPKILLRSYVTVSVESRSSLDIEWEFWDGKSWSCIQPSRDETLGFSRSGEIVFEPLPNLEETEIFGKRTSWIRARAHFEGDESLPTLTVKRGIELMPGEGVVPDKVYLSTEVRQPPIPSSTIYAEKDVSKEFYPFDVEPKQNDVFYIGSWVFSTGGSTVSIKVDMSEKYVPPTSEALTLPELHWEYYSDGGTWELLGITAPTGVIKSEHNFQDETGAFTSSGRVSFNYPEGIAPFSIQGEEKFWVRVRMERGSYGGEQANPPFIRSFLISFHENPKNFENYVSDNYFNYEDLAPVVNEKKAIKPFQIIHEDPTLYLAFDSPMAAGEPHRIHLRLAEEREIDLSEITKEYFSEGGWRELKIRADTTKYFSRGTVEFFGPADWERSVMFEQEGYWIRARWKGEAYHRFPRLLGVHLNAVEVIQAVSIRDEILGSSTGAVDQTFTFANTPIIPYPEMPKILVKEVENPSHEDIERFRKLKEEIEVDVIEEKDPGTDKISAIWVEWMRVEENFLYSGPKDRHYILDLSKGIITFGNGKRGRIPAEVKDNIKCEVYYIGGGAKGNVGKDTITVLETASTFIKSVTNPDPAGGGADAETIEEAKLRGPWTLKHRDRAVTKEDFEELAKQAAGEVAKAWCFPNGVIKVIIVPKSTGDSEKEKLEPSDMLIQKVKKYLDERRLITAKLDVAGPKYKDILIEAWVVASPRKAEVIDQMQLDMENKLGEFFHPLKGGPEKNGWPIGRTVHISEIYYLLESIEGVDYVDEVWLSDKEGGEKTKGVSRIEMEDEKGKFLPYLEGVKINVLVEEFS